MIYFWNVIAFIEKNKNRAITRSRRTLIFFILINLPYIIYFMFKARSLTFFTLVNPGIQYGGLLGYSKYLLNTQFDKSYIPKSVFVQQDCKWDVILQKIEGAALKFPCIIKPDIGERSKGVLSVRNIDDLAQVINTQNGAVIIEEYINAKNEYGILYSKLPGEKKGEITSFVRKKGIPQVIDDKINFAEISKKLSFEDLTPYITPNLLSHFDRISSEIDGFYFGRFDIKANNIEELNQGIFSIIELNGIGSVPLHIYDPHTSIRECYKYYGMHYKRAFEIAAVNNDLKLNRYSPKTLLSVVIKTYAHLNRIS